MFWETIAIKISYMAEFWDSRHTIISDVTTVAQPGKGDRMDNGSGIIGFRSVSDSFDDCTAVSTDVKFRKKYFLNDSRGKARMLFENYRSFPEIIEGMTNILKMDIICEQEYRKNSHRDNISVQSSHISDPTANTAIREAELDDAIRNGDISSVIGDEQMAFFYGNTLSSIRSMNHDFIIMKSFVGMLPESDRDIILDYFECKARAERMDTIAEKYDIQIHTTYERVRRIKARLIESVAPNLDRKYERRKTA